MSTEREALRRPGFFDLLDVSVCQRDLSHPVDWGKVKAAGFDAAIMKVADGVSGRDPARVAFLEGARLAGIRCMVYLFARLDADPKAQVENMWEASGDQMPYRFMLDCEVLPRGMAPAAVVDNMCKLADAVLEYTILEPVVYTAQFFTAPLGAALANCSRLARCPLHVAQYMSTKTAWVPPVGQESPHVMAPWSSWVLRQYSGDGGFRVPGISVDCDRNLFNGDARAFDAFCGLPDPDVEPTSTRIVHALPDLSSLVEDDETA